MKSIAYCQPGEEPEAYALWKLRVDPATVYKIAVSTTAQSGWVASQLPGSKQVTIAAHDVVLFLM